MDIDEIGFRLIIISIISLFILVTFIAIHLNLIAAGFTGINYWLTLIVVGGLMGMLEVGIALVNFYGG